MASDTGIECSRCGTRLSLDDAVMLTQTNNKELWRYLCPPCLDAVRVPQGYEIVRDLSHLGGTADTTPADGAEGDSDVIADFTGQVVTDEMAHGELRPGRIVMTRRRLVLATETNRTTVPLSAIHDIGIGQASEATTEYFDDVAIVRYRRDGDDRVAFVGSTPDVIDRFSLVLFKALLTGTAVRLKHPIETGGHLRSPPVQSGVLRLDEGALRVDRIDPPVSIALDRITDLTRRRPSWADGQPALEVRYLRDSRPVVSSFTAPSERRLQLLGRYAQRVYGDRKEAVEEMDLSDAEVRGLVCLYASGSAADVAAVLDRDPDRVTDLLASLADRDLVTDREDPSLTLTGRVAVHRYFGTIDG